MSNSESVVRLYKRRLDKITTKVTYEVPVWIGFDDKESTSIKLECFEIVPGSAGVGFSYQGSKWQYDVGNIQGKRFRPNANRVPFVDDEHFLDTKWTCSHLCHNDECYNPQHIALEPLDVNKGRNGCPGGNHCHHRIKCIRPGQFYNQ